MIACKRLIKNGLIGSRLLTLAQQFRGPRTLVLRYHSVRDEPNDYATSDYFPKRRVMERITVVGDRPV